MDDDIEGEGDRVAEEVWVSVAVLVDVPVPDELCDRVTLGDVLGVTDTDRVPVGDRDSVSCSVRDRLGDGLSVAVTDDDVDCVVVGESLPERVLVTDCEGLPVDVSVCVVVCDAEGDSVTVGDTVGDVVRDRDTVNVIEGLTVAEGDDVSVCVRLADRDTVADNVGEIDVESVG